jgi:hypothetical protein
MDMAADTVAMNERQMTSDPTSIIPQAKNTETLKATMTGKSQKTKKTKNRNSYWG